MPGEPTAGFALFIPISYPARIILANVASSASWLRSSQKIHFFTPLCFRLRMLKSRMYAMYLKAYLNGCYTLLPQEKQASIPFKNSP